jgi:hypothetical protein
MVLLALFLLPAIAGGSSLRQLDVDEITAASELIFEGRVISRKVTHEKDSRTLRTRVTFEVLEVIKGEYAEERLTLSFLGGQLDGLSLEVSDMRIPRVGEHGIYFVERLNQPMANPLVGWHQGHYLVKQQAATRAAVTTLDGQPVYGLEGMPTLWNRRLSRSGGARGVILQPVAGQSRPLTPEDFKQRLRELME